MAEIDDLQIRIEAEASKANSAIDTLATKLDTLYNSLGRINGASVSSFASSVTQLSSAVQGVASIDGRTFTALARNFDKIASINSAGIGQSATAITDVATAFSQLGNASQASANVATLVSAVSKLGNKSVTTAITNIPQLATALNQLMATLSKAPTVNKSVIDMTNALANLAAQGSKVGSASHSVVNGLNRTNAAAKQTAISTKSLASAFGKFYANYFLLVRGFKALYGSMQSAMELTETVNYFEVTLRNIGENAKSDWEKYGYESADAYAETFAQRLKQSTEKLTGFAVSDTGKVTKSQFAGLGISPAMTTQYSAMFAQVANSIGMTEEASIALSEAFVRLGADWASLRNVDFEVAYEKLASGLSGQSRALRAFGIDITMATLQETAFRNGITKSVSEMTQAEKSYLRLIAIIEQSEVAFGDLANTLQSPANQMRMLEQGVKNLATLTGNLFIPILSKALPVLNGFVIALQRIVIAVSESMGIDTSGFNTSLGGMTDEFDGLTDGIEDTNEAAEAFNKATRGWDELNILGSKNDKGYGVGNENIADNEELLNAYDKAIEEYRKQWGEAYDKINNEAESFADKILSVLNVWDKEELYQGAEGFGENIATLINGAITVENFKKVGDTVGTVLNAAIKASLSAKEHFDFGEAGRAVAEGINSIFEELDGADFAKGLNEFADGIFEVLKEAFANLDYKEIASFVSDFFDELEIDTLTLLIGAISLKATGTTVTALLGNALKNSLFKGVSLKSIALTISSFAVTSSSAFQITGSEILSKISDWVDKLIPEWAYDLLSNVGAGIVTGALAGSWFPGAGTVAGAIVGAIVSAIQTIKIDGETIWKKLFNFDNTKLVLEFSDSFFADIGNAFKDKDWARLGMDIVGGIVTGFAAPFYAVTEPFVDFFYWIWDGICDIFGIASPAKEMYPLGEYIALGVVEGFKGIKSEFYKVISDWYTKYVAPWFGEKKWNFEGISKGLLKAFNTAFDAIKKLWNGFAEWINNALSLDFDGFTKQFEVFGKKIEIGLPAFNVQLGKLPTFQTGGFPEDGLFMANHNELVGKFSNGKTAVANNEQITKGIEEAAYRGMARALANADFGSHATLEIKGDPSGMFKVMQKQANQYEKSTGRKAFGY